VQGSSDGAQASDAGGVKATLSPAMDILVSSNFERLLWYIAHETASGDDEARVQQAGEQLAAWMAQLKTEGRMQVSEQQLKLAQRDFAAERVSDAEVSVFSRGTRGNEVVRERPPPPPSL
jgi:threonine synthase